MAPVWQDPQTERRHRQPASLWPTTGWCTHIACSKNQHIAQPDQSNRTLSVLHRNVVSSFSTKYVKVLLFRFFSPLRHFFFFDGATWSQLDLFLSRKVLLNCSLLLRSCDPWLEVALGRFSQLFWEELATTNCFFRSVCANMLPVRAKCRADVQLASLYRSCLSKDQTSRNGNIWSYVLSVSSKEVFPPKKMDGSVMKDARGACASCCRMSLGATDSEKKKATDDVIMNQTLIYV